MDWYYEELVTWIEVSKINEFCELIGKEFLSNNNIKTDLKYDPRMEPHFNNGYFIVLDLVPICKEFGIEPRNILNQQI